MHYHYIRNYNTKKYFYATSSYFWQSRPFSA